MLLSPAALQAAFINFDTRFQSVFGATPTHYEKFATEIPSSTDEERHAWLSKLPQLRKWVGPRVVNNIAARVQTLKNDLYEDTFAVKRTSIEDDRLGVYAPAVAELARQAKIWPDKIVTDALIAGGTTTTYDGQYFFDTDHPVNMDDPNSASQVNLHTSKALSAANYATVRAAMMAYKGEDGVPLEIMPNLLIVPPALEKTAREILHADMISTVYGSNSAAAAQTNVWKGSADLLVLPRLAADSDTTWYLADTTRAIKPLIFQLRAAPEFVYLNNPNDPTVFQMDEFQFGVRARGAAGYGLWFLCSKCTA